MNYFKKLLDLLKIERQEDQQSYLKFTEIASVSDRRSNGITWYPVAIKGSEMGRGDYLTVEIERTTHQDLAHQFRFGMSAALFSNHDAKQDRISGVISYQRGNQLNISIQAEELPEWASQGKLGVDLLFDDNSYDAMEEALRQAFALSENPEKGNLIKILTGAHSPAFQAGFPGIRIPALNPSQEAAVNKILSAQELAIVHGPPGTGKTTTLVKAIHALYKQEKLQILVVAPSNTAVDLLSEKLSDEGLQVLRIGNPARVSDRLMSLTLDHKIASHPRMKEARNLKKQANAFRDMAQKYKRHFGKADREQRRLLFSEAHKIMKEVSHTEQYITDDLTEKAQIITATLVGSSHYTVRKRSFHTVVIDEAGQALEPACWIPVLKGKKIIMAGDPFQLPPTVKSNLAARSGLGVTLFEKCMALHRDSVVVLEEQYRMHETIMGYSANVFYSNQLKAHPSVAHHLLFSSDMPLEFIDTAGCGFEEKSDGTSTTNPEEAALLLKHLTRLVQSIPLIPVTVAVISPYKQQVQVLKEQLNYIPELVSMGHRIAVNTIDSFQGQERDIVYISMTRSNPEGAMGFLADIRRMNVAMTRARKKLVVVGDSATLSSLPFYKNFIEYAEEKKAYKSAWEFVDD